MPCLLKMGGGTKSKVMVSVSKEIWDYLLSHRIATTAEYLPGVINLESISKSEEYKQMEIVHKDIQNDFSSQGNTRHRYICLRNISIASSIHDFETRPFSRSQDDFQINWNWTFTQSSGSSKKSRRKESPTDSGEFSKDSGLDHLMESLHVQGMSKTAITFITSSRRISPVKHYESAWGKWVCWCSKREVCPTVCDVSYVLNFLAELFEGGLQYRTIGSQLHLHFMIQLGV